MTEQWLPIPDFPGYEVSDCGQVRSYHGQVKGNGETWSILDIPQRILRSSVDENGYHFVILRRRGKSFLHRIHRLVMLAFVGPCPDGLETCHNDGNPANNLLANLRYDNHKANAQDALIHGSWDDRRLFSDSEILEIRNACAGGMSRKEAAEIWGASDGLISLIATGQRYPDIGGPRSRGGLGWDKVYQIRQAWHDGETMAHIGQRYGITESAVSLIVNNKRWIDPEYTRALPDAATLSLPENHARLVDAKVPYEVET